MAEYTRWEKANPVAQRPDKRKKTLDGVRTRMKWEDEDLKIIEDSRKLSPKASDTALAKAVSEVAKIPKESVLFRIKNQKSILKRMAAVEKEQKQK